MPLSCFRQGMPIRLSEGVLSATYATLRTDERGEKLSRVRQIVEWLGSDFDGVIVFDESHAMQNAVGGKCHGQAARMLSGRASWRTGGGVMARDASELARRLAREAEAVCRHYLSNGKREGRYWLVGDVQNTPGRSLFVRLYESPKGPAGKWTDAATGEHGDLLDIIRERLALRDFRDVADEARRFLNLPRPAPELAPRPVRPVVQRGSREAARRLFAISRPTEGTLVETIPAPSRYRGAAPRWQSPVPTSLLLPRA